MLLILINYLVLLFGQQWKRGWTFSLRVVDDSNLSVWHSNWLSKGTLQNFIKGPLPREVNQLEVKYFLWDMGWDWNRLSFELPLDVKMMIQAIPFAMTSREGISSRGLTLLKVLLTWKVPIRLRWGMMRVRNSVLVGFRKWIPSLELKHFSGYVPMTVLGLGVVSWRGVYEEDLCPICQEAPESVFHTLRDCS